MAVCTARWKEKWRQKKHTAIPTESERGFMRGDLTANFIDRRGSIYWNCKKDGIGWNVKREDLGMVWNLSLHKTLSVKRTLKLNIENWTN